MTCDYTLALTIWISLEDLLLCGFEWSRGKQKQYDDFTSWTWLLIDGCKGEYCQRCTLLSAIRSIMVNESNTRHFSMSFFFSRKKQPRRTNFLKFVFVDEMQIKCWREETKTSCRRYGGSPATDGSPDVGSSLFIRSASAPGKRARAPPSETR